MSRVSKNFSVAYLVVEVASLLAEALVEENVVAGGGGEHHTHTHAVSTVFVDEQERVGRVAETLRHLSAQFVAHDACEIDMLERHGVAVLIASHYHSCHPEEDDVGTGDEVAGGVVVVYFLVVGMLYSVEEGNGPQP